MQRGLQLRSDSGNIAFLEGYPRSPGTHIVGPWVTDSIKIM